jgi:hypothetical protein
LYDIRIPSESDLEDILDAIDQIPIHIGIFEAFADSMTYFEQIADLKWKKEIDAKRITFKRPLVSELNQATKDLILECNALDLELYDYGLKKFKAIQKTLKPSKITFNKDKYLHIIPYVAKTCLFEFCVEHKKFIKAHFLFFKDLTFYLLKTLQIKDGKNFTKVWNATFVHSIQQHFPNSLFEKQITAAYQEQKDPLETTTQLGSVIDQFFKKYKQEAHPFYVSMHFSEQLIIKEALNLSQSPKKESLFRRFFKK